MTQDDISKDHYAALGILPTADKEVIAAAYRALVKKFHPDTGREPGTASAERFQAVQEAYELLSDPKRRRAYDDARTQRLAAPDVMPEAEDVPPPPPPRRGERPRQQPKIQLPPSETIPPEWRAPRGRPRRIGFVALVAALMLAVAVGAFLFTLPEAEAPQTAPSASVTPEARPPAAAPETEPPAQQAETPPEQPAEPAPQQATIPQEPSPQIAEPEPAQPATPEAAPEEKPPSRYVLSMYEKAGNVTTTLANGSLSFNSRRACEDFALQARERRLDAMMMENGSRPEVWFECRGVTSAE